MSDAVATSDATPTIDTTAPRLARSLPKVELHCHLEGSIRPETVAALARKNGVALPVADPVELYRFASLADFLEVYAIICASLHTADDFRRITYEALEDASAAGIRYREMFFSPGFLLPYGVRLDTMWAGIRAGLADAHADLDIRCRMILDVDKGDDGAAAVELVEFAAAQDRDELIGVGGDNTERGIDHHVFAAGVHARRPARPAPDDALRRGRAGGQHPRRHRRRSGASASTTAWRCSTTST